MKKTIYNYFSYEIIRCFTVVIFATTAIIWTIQAVNFLDLVTDDGHAFKIYLFYSTLTIPKIITKLFPFSFLIALILTILKFEKDNELIILWMSGLNKIHVVNLIFRVSILIMLLQIVMAAIINPEILNLSRTLLKNSELQFVSSLLREKQFNDAVKGLTIFVDEKNNDGSYENIFIRDDGKVLTQVSEGASTIFAKSGHVSENAKSLILYDGNIQKRKADGNVNIVKFQKTSVNLAGLSTRSTPEPKIQETSTKRIIMCLQKKIVDMHNCRDGFKETKIEINKRFGMPMFIPLISLVSCFLLTSRKDKKYFGVYKYLYFIIGFLILIGAEIGVRYSGISLNHTLMYYLTPIGALPIVYLFLIKAFKYENLN